jgi:hypothetical protein
MKRGPPGRAEKPACPAEGRLVRLRLLVILCIQLCRRGGERPKQTVGIAIDTRREEQGGTRRGASQRS